MTEKKKRIRPTLTQVRALEKEISNRDNTIKQLQDRLLEHKEACHKQNQAYQELRQKYDKLEPEITALRQSNSLLDEELGRMRHANASLNELNDQYRERVYGLACRGFWARVFNLGV